MGKITPKTQPKKWQDIVPASAPPTQKKLPKKTRVYPTYRSFIPHLTLPHVSFSRRRVVIGAVVFVVILAAVSFTIVSTRTSNISTDQTSVPEGLSFTTTQLTKGIPDYTTILPVGKNIDDFGGWTRVSPTNKDPVYAYVDNLGGNSINVSQQPLPIGFRNDAAEQVALLAQDFNASQLLTVGETLVYVGTSANGPQSLILTKAGLLVLIRSSVVIDNKLWASYVEALR